MRILVVEDERKVAADLAKSLAGSGHVIDEAQDGDQAWFLGDTEDYDLVILDLGLPKLDGTQVLKRWRANQRTMPVLVLTARDSWSEKVDAIDTGYSRVMAGVDNAQYHGQDGDIGAFGDFCL